jgi:hypothetical protein
VPESHLDNNANSIFIIAAGTASLALPLRSKFVDSNSRMNTPKARARTVVRNKDSQGDENESIRLIYAFGTGRSAKKIYFSIEKSISQFAGRYRVLFGIFWKLPAVSLWISIRTRYNEILFFDA